MAKNEDGPSLKPIEARQAEPGPSVLAILVASVAMAVMILGVVWYAFFHS